MRMIAAAALVLVVAACGGSSHNEPTAKSAAKNAKPYVPPATHLTEPTTTTQPAKPTDAVALAARLGCPSPKSDTTNTIDFGPKATASVDCNLPDGTEITIDTFTPDGVKAIRGPILTAAVCDLLKGFGDEPPYYTIYGTDFVANVQASDPSTPDPNYYAKSKALAEAIGVPLTTITCKK